jgi:hypothetical protein
MKNYAVGVFSSFIMLIAGFVKIHVGSEIERGHTEWLCCKLPSFTFKERK